MSLRIVLGAVAVLLASAVALLRYALDGPALRGPSSTSGAATSGERYRVAAPSEPNIHVSDTPSPTSPPISPAPLPLRLHGPHAPTEQELSQYPGPRPNKAGGRSEWGTQPVDALQFMTIVPNDSEAGSGNISSASDASAL